MAAKKIIHQLQTLKPNEEWELHMKKWKVPIFQLSGVQLLSKCPNAGIPEFIDYYRKRSCNFFFFFRNEKVNCSFLMKIMLEQTSKNTLLMELNGESIDQLKDQVQKCLVLFMENRNYSNSLELMSNDNFFEKELLDPKNEEKNLSLLFSGKSLSHILSNNYLIYHFQLLAKISTFCIGYNMNQAAKEQLVSILKKDRKSQVLAVGAEYSDEKMMQLSDSSIFLNANEQSELSGDIEIQKSFIPLVNIMSLVKEKAMNFIFAVKILL